MAAIAAEAMDGYMMFAQKLKVEVVSRSRQHPSLMRGSKKPFKASLQCTAASSLDPQIADWACLRLCYILLAVQADHTECQHDHSVYAHSVCIMYFFDCHEHLPAGQLLHILYHCQPFQQWWFSAGILQQSQFAFDWLHASLPKCSRIYAYTHTHRHYLWELFCWLDGRLTIA